MRRIEAKKRSTAVGRAGWPECWSECCSLWSLTGGSCPVVCWVLSKLRFSLEFMSRDCSPATPGHIGDAPDPTLNSCVGGIPRVRVRVTIGGC
ncbi:hypothetical protein GCM10027519_23280 [Kineococcus endophyticus]